MRQPLREEEAAVAEAFIAAVIERSVAQLRWAVGASKDFQALIQQALEEAEGDSSQAGVALRDAIFGDRDIDRQATNAATGLALTVVDAVVGDPPEK